MATSLSQHGITWTFDGDYTTGQYCNGDYYVVGPVNITDIDPPTQLVWYADGGYNRQENGSMINPVVQDLTGLDSHAETNYSAALNVAIGVSAGSPLVLGVNESLVSAISRDPTTSSLQTHIESAAILTCVSEAPASGSFRPPYTGTDKTSYFNESQIRTSLLQSLTPTASAPNWVDLEAYFTGPYIEFYANWKVRYEHPRIHMWEYGRDLAGQIGVGALMLNTNASYATKRTTLIGMIQIGIDFYDIFTEQFFWANDGGIFSGRKWPILFAGIMLGDNDMRNIGLDNPYVQYGPNIFHEDGQTFYVDQTDIDVTNGGTWNPDSRDAEMYPYTSSEIGMPEWGIRRSSEPNRSNKWWQTKYRISTNGACWIGYGLSALMIKDGKYLWNHNPFFDYLDRYTAITNGDPDPFGYTVQGEVSGGMAWDNFTAEMWTTYRDSFPLESAGDKIIAFIV